VDANSVRNEREVGINGASRIVDANSVRKECLVTSKLKS
jgi:hypothetical protein